MKRFSICACVALALASCTGGRPSSGAEDSAPQVRELPSVTPPAILEGQEQIEYIVDHFWDALVDTAGLWLCDSLHIGGIEKGKFEQSFANYTGCLGYVSVDYARKALSELYSRLSATRQCRRSNVFAGMMDVAERYLYDPNSPVRNEDFWQPLAAALASDPATDPELAGSYAYAARTCLLNRVGTKAADFRWSDRDGMIHTLYGIKADYTLLFFSNPGCQACKAIIETLRESDWVSAMLADGRLAVVNVYIDEDVEAWYGYMSFYPEEWYNGYDPDLVIRTDLLYNVRAIPSLYMLDGDKTVIMKDAPEQKVFAFLDNCR